MTVEHPSSTIHRAPLAPVPVRVLVYLVLVLVGVGSIWLIDRRAMTRMAQTQAVATLPADVARQSVQRMAEAHLAQRYGERADDLFALVPLQENRLRWTVLFIPPTQPGDPPPRHTLEVHVDAATGRAQYVRHHR
ncbi:MAG: hypothetical protein WD534_06510 [Phycisphaeraceae bacterium]